MLNCSNSIKQKAFEKLKELNNSKGDTNAKAQHYIDGLLKIPFGIYKTESICTYIKETGVKAITASSIYHFTETTPLDVKKYLKKKNYL